MFDVSDVFDNMLCVLCFGFVFVFCVSVHVLCLVSPQSEAARG